MGNFLAWAFTASVVHSYFLPIFVVALIQAYCFALAALFLGRCVVYVYYSECSVSFVLFARHIHVSFLEPVLMNFSGASVGLFALLGVIFLFCAFWLHFSLTRFAAQLCSEEPSVVPSLFVCMRPISWRQVARVIVLSSCATLLPALGLLLGFVPGIVLYIRWFAVFPIFADNPSLSIRSIFGKSWFITRSHWRTIVGFSLETAVIYILLIYWASYLFLVGIIPFARYAWYRSIVQK